MKTKYCTITWPTPEVVWVMLKRPEKSNALNADLLAELTECFEKIGSDKTSMACVVISGEGKSFCSGADLMDIQGLGAGSKHLGVVLDEHFLPMFQAISKIKVPIICALNGPAVGIGVMLALSGDIIIATQDSYLKLGFSQIGLVPDGGITYWLPRVLGYHKAMQMVLLDEVLSAKDAENQGVFYQVVTKDSLHERVMSTAKRLALVNNKVTIEAKSLMKSSLDASYIEQWNKESKKQSACGKEKAFKEAVWAFLKTKYKAP